MPAGKWCSIAGTKKTGSYTAGQPVLRETHCRSENCCHTRTLFTWMLQVWHGNFGGWWMMWIFKIEWPQVKIRNHPCSTLKLKGQHMGHGASDQTSLYQEYLTTLRLDHKDVTSSGRRPTRIWAKSTSWMQSNFNLSVTVPGMLYGESWPLSKLLVERMQKTAKVRSRIKKSNFQVERIKGSEHTHQPYWSPLIWSQVYPLPPWSD